MLGYTQSHIHRVWRTKWWLRGGLVGWGTALKARRSWVRLPMGSLEFFIYLNLPAAARLWGRFTLEYKWVYGYSRAFEFESQPDHPFMWGREIFPCLNFCARTLNGKDFLSLNPLIFHPCLSGRDSFETLRKNQIFRSLFCPFIELTNLKFQPRNKYLWLFSHASRGHFVLAEDLIKFNL